MAKTFRAQVRLHNTTIKTATRFHERLLNINKIENTLRAIEGERLPYQFSLKGYDEIENQTAHCSTFVLRDLFRNWYEQPKSALKMVKEQAKFDEFSIGIYDIDNCKHFDAREVFDLECRLIHAIEPRHRALPRFAPLLSFFENFCKGMEDMQPDIIVTMEVKDLAGNFYGLYKFCPEVNSPLNSSKSLLPYNPYSILFMDRFDISRELGLDLEMPLKKFREKHNIAYNDQDAFWQERTDQYGQIQKYWADKVNKTYLRYK